MIVLCDIDGVVIDPCKYVRIYLSGSVKNWKGYYAHTSEFPAVPSMVAMLQSLMKDRHEVIFHTGRNESNRIATGAQLLQLFPDWIPPEYKWLLMRPNGNRESPAILKLANCQVYHPALVIDDEPETVELLQRRGYTVLQVHGHRVSTDDKKDNIPD